MPDQNLNGANPSRRAYDAIVAGARCAGAATAMLLARQGMRVLLVDPARRGSDTLSTHALMRGAVLQLHRWGVLPRIAAAGTPPVRSTTFRYAEDSIEVPIKPRDGIEGLYAPRRTVLDLALLEAAEEAGVEVRLGHSVVGLQRNASGRVTGATVADSGQRETEISSSIVIGADGVRSHIAQLVGAPVIRQAAHTTASIYGYYRDLGLDGYQWFYQINAAVGAIPTNDRDTCVFVSLPPGRFARHREVGVGALYHEALEYVSPMLAERTRASLASSKLRAFPGIRGFLRRATGPGWALVGDAGYFKDPLTAHGITDALRDAELLARAVADGGDSDLSEYQATRDRLATGLFEVTDRIASFEWDLAEVKELHLALSDEMKAEVRHIMNWDKEAGSPATAASA